MELEFKYIAPYLPYDLLGVCTRSYSLGEGFWVKPGDEVSPNQTMINPFLTHCSPYLRPMTDLDRETEKGLTYWEEVLVKAIRFNSDNFEYQNTHLVEFRTLLNNKKGYDHIPHWMFQDLIKWHFDVFGLIKKGLAMDINEVGA